MTEALAEPQPVADIQPWRGRSNVITVASVALLDFIKRVG